MEEITFQGYIKPFADKTFIGFDTNHYRNTLNPQTQTKEVVKCKIIEIVDHMETWPQNEDLNCGL
jgi:hypothetical protein